jgi:hypothetical protein
MAGCFLFMSALLLWLYGGVSIASAVTHADQR